MPYIFKESFRIRSNETDVKGSLRPDALTGLLQEAAGNHAKKLEFDIMDLQENNLKKGKRFEVHYSDLDLNNHLNNTVYVRWILDTLPVNIVETGYCKELVIKFKSEAKYGNGILSFMENQEENFYIHKLLSEKGTSCHAEANTFWTTAN